MNENTSRKSIRVLVADDEPAMRRGICTSLNARGYLVDEARNGEEALTAIRERPADLVLLDINMPGMGGIEACRRIRSAFPGVGIVMITVRDSEEDTVEALEAGADDYITKPFRVRELLARLSALLRRARGEEPGSAAVIRAGKLELNLEHRILRKGGEEIHLSPIEFNLLQYLMQNRDVPLDHSKLLRTIWGPEYGHELEYLRTYIRLLRRKIEDNPAKPEYITTEPWMGYRFRDPSGSAVAN
ncbi:MAG TPA: response regulator transcription factor [Bryobacteraceae bacterium]|nr:response regulator transcription factor [Bryobacteraceae bacterium]